MSPPTLNPVMLKELRQLVRARFISSVVLVFLVAELSIIGIYAIKPTLILGLYAAGRTQGLAAAAGPLFRSLLMVLSLVCGVAIPGYVGIRLGRERSEANLDLLFATTLKPGAIIRGKLYSGLILVALMFSLAMPFMTFIYLFRGLDLSTVFLGLGCVFLASVVLMQFGLLVGSLPTTRMFKAIVPLALLGVLGWSCYLFWFHYVFSHYWGSRPSGTAWVFRRLTVVYPGSPSPTAGGSGSLWMGLLIASLLVLAFACFHALSVTFLNPPAANRAFPARLTLAGVWLAAGILALMADARGVTYNALSVWAYATLVASGVGLAIAVSERDQLGLRVKRAVPRGGLLRALAFPFFSGSASGILWACLLMGVTSVALPFLDWGFRARPIRSETAHRILTLFLYSFSYALTAAWLRNRFLSEWFSAKYTGILALFLAGAGIWLPFLFDLLVWDMTFDQVMRYSQHFGSILTVLGPRSLEEILRHELFAGIWAAAVLALNFPWLLKQVAAFFRAPVRSSARQGASATFRRLVRKPVSR